MEYEAARLLSPIGGVRYQNWFHGPVDSGLILLESVFDVLTGEAVMEADDLLEGMAWAERHRQAILIESALNSPLIPFGRGEVSDPDVWLLLENDWAKSGDERPVSCAPQQALALIALWKAYALRAVSAEWHKTIDTRRIFAEADGDDDLPAMVRSLRVERMRLVQGLTYELARAATFARGLEDAQRRETAGRSALARAGANARAEKYKPIRELVLRMAPDMPAKSRDQTAELILAELRSHGHDIKFTTVRTWLEQHDKELRGRQLLSARQSI